jgi:hypothetical protein
MLSMHLLAGCSIKNKRERTAGKRMNAGVKWKKGNRNNVNVPLMQFTHMYFLQLPFH